MLINIEREPKYSLFYIGYEILDFLKNKKMENVLKKFMN